MKNKLFIFSFFLLLIFVTIKPAHAQWVKKETPVLDISPGSWDSLHVSSPGIICEDNLCKMWYGGESEPNKTSIGYATSTDGINWTKYQNNPVIQPSVIEGVTEQGVGEPTIVHNDKYRLWYTSIGPGEAYRIGHAVSDDGINWTKHPTFAFTTYLSWENCGVSHPYVIFEDDTYHMWYTGWGLTSSWKLGYATSIDGINWTQSASNPLYVPSLGHIGAPSVTKINNLYHLYYHTGGSIPTNIYHAISEDKINWTCQDNCVVLSRSSGFDSQMLARAEIFQGFNRLNLLYGGYDGTHWRIGLATNTPIVESKTPIIIIPGFLGSWNNQAILYNQTVDYDQWSIPEFVKEYDAIKKTLVNLNYVEQKDFYFFAYDWRDSVENSADKLKQFINNKIPNNKLNLVGHSLGGLIARIYTQKYSIDKINKLVTVGSPHQGTALVYKAVEAGEIDQNDNLMWLASKIILNLNKAKFETDKETINKSFPVLVDLFPIYNFLKNNKGQEISVNNLSIKNNLLTKYQIKFPEIYPVFQSIAGEKGNTLSGYEIKQRSSFEQLLDLYPDGKPVNSFSEPGDYTIISRSAQAGNNSKVLDLEHGELIYKIDGIKTIFEKLDIPYQTNQLVEGQSTKITPSLIFFILSPAEIEVVYNGNTYQATDGVIFIENYQSGEYTIKTKGKEPGKYTIVIGQLNQNNDNWLNIQGEIKQTSPTSQTDTYFLNLDPQSIQPPQLSSNDLFSQLLLIMNNLYKQTNNRHLKNVIYYLNESNKTNKPNKPNKNKVRVLLLKAHQQMFLAFRQVNPDIKSKLIQTLPMLEVLYDKTLIGYKNSLTQRKLRISLEIYKKLFNGIENRILFFKKIKIKLNINKKVLIETEARMKLAEEAIKNNNLNYAEILLESIKELIKNII